jgi:flavin-dependent dehydrogenase
MVEYARAPGVLVQRIAGMKSFLPSGAIEHNGFSGLMVDRAAFDRALADRAAQAGAELATGTALCGLDLTGCRAEIRRGRRTEAVRYAVLIAADGPHSPVARHAGLPELETVQTRQYTVPLRRPYADTDIWLSDEYPGGYGWLFPKGGLANLGLGADRRWQADLKTPLDRLHAHLVRAGLVGEGIVFRTGGAIPVGGMREHLVHETILFVGDAAGLTHPITGAGIAAAVQSGERAGEAAAEYLAGGDRARLEAYDEDVREQYGPALGRALARRAWLAQFWRSHAANDDTVQRRGWIAFREYYD